MTSPSLQLITQLVLIKNKATTVRTSERCIIEKERAMLQALIDNGLFHDKQNKVAKQAPKWVSNKLSKKAPKIHLKRKTQIKRLTLWANCKKIERWYTANAGWALVIDRTGDDKNDGPKISDQAENLLEAVEEVE